MTTRAGFRSRRVNRTVLCQRQVVFLTLNHYHNYG